MDVLSKVLRGVRLTGAFFFESIAYGEWAIVTPWLTEIAHVMPLHEHIISFHVVTEGACWVELHDGSVPPVRLKAGDVVVLPKGDEHVMASSRGLRATPNYSDFDIPPGRQLPLHSIVNEAAGGPVTCHFVCGFFGCDATPFNPLLEALPPIFRATTSPANRSLLALLADAGVEESEKNRTARDTKLARLAELMFVEVVRQYIDALPQESPRLVVGG